jgi:hypothetical protein
MGVDHALQEDQRRNDALGNSTLGCPSIHQTSAFFEQVASPVSSLGTITNHVSHSSLGSFMRKVGALGDPIAECGAEAMRSTGAVSPGEQSYIEAPCRQIPM